MLDAFRTLSSSKFVISFLVLGLSALLGTRASLLLLGAATLVLFLPILNRQPELGLTALLIVSLCIPLTIGTGTQTSLNSSVLLAPVLLAIWIVSMLARRKFGVVPSSINLSLFLFVASATISFLAGNLPWNIFAERASLPAQAGGWAIFVLSAGTFLLVGNQIRDSKWLSILVGTFLLLGALVVLGRIFPLIGVISSKLIVAQAQGSLFWVWLAALSTGQALFNRDLGNKRLAFIVLSFLTLGVGWANRDWASGWIPPLAAETVLVCLWRPRIVIPLIAVGTILIVTVYSGQVSSLAAADQYSIDTRFAASQIMLTQVLQANPIIGLGPANYYFYTPLFPIFGWYVRFNSHNQYLDILAETGIIGMVLFIWLMLKVGRLGWSLRERVKCEFERGYVFGCLGGLVGTLVAGMLGDWFLPFIYNIGLAGFRASILGWLFLGGLVALEQIVKQSENEPIVVP